MTPEGKVKEKIDQLLKQHGAYVLKPVTYGQGTSGAHDRFVLYNGHAISIEAKATEKDAPTGIQNLHAHDVYNQGGHVLLIHKNNLQELKNLLDSIDLAIKLGIRAPQVIVWPNSKTVLRGTFIKEK